MSKSLGIKYQGKHVNNNDDDDDDDDDNLIYKALQCVEGL